MLKDRKAGDSICHVAARNGSVNVFKKYSRDLKDLSPEYVRNTKNDETWLHAAFKADKDEIARYIFENFQDLASNYIGETIIKSTASSATSSEFIKKRSRVLHTIAAVGLTELIPSDFSLDDVDQSDSILHTAAQHGHLDSVTKMIDVLEGKQLTKEDKEKFEAILKAPNKSNKETLLHLSGKYSDTTTFLSLVEKGLDIEAKDSLDNTPLDYLIESSNPIGELEQFVRDLCKLKGEQLLKMKNKNGETLLHVICKNGDIGFVKFLLTMGGCLRQEDEIGNTPLHCLVSAIPVPTLKSDGQITDASQSAELEDVQRSAREKVDKFLCFVTSLSEGKLGCKCTISEPKSLLKKANKKDQTILHLASKRGNVRVVEFLIKEGIYSTGLYDLICSIETSEDRRIQDVNDLPDEFVKDTKDTKLKSKSNTIQHVIAANGLTPLVKKFSFVDVSKKDRNGDTALHTAARNKNFETLQQIINTYEDMHGESKLKTLIDKEDTDGETVLHIVCKLAHAETVQFLIKKGADLEAQDKTGNTPLHDLVDKAATDEAIDKYIDVWKIFVDNVHRWWRSKLKLKHLDKFSPEYKTYQRDAIYHLRSEILNNQNLSVIQLAATKGLVRLVKEMIWVEDVFVKHNSEKARVVIDITNLMPHLGGGNDVNYMNKSEYFESMENIEETSKRLGDDDSDTDDSSISGSEDRCCKCYDSDDLSPHDVADCCCKCYDSDCDFDKDGCFACGKLACCFPCIMSYFLFGTTHGKHHHSLLDAILKVPQGNKANEIFQIEPMKQLVRDYWFAHQWWTFIMLTVHLIYMTLYSSYCLNMTSKAFGNNETNVTLGELVTNEVYLIWPVMLAVPYVGLLFAAPLLWFFRSGKRRSIRERVIGATKIDVKDIFNWPSVFLSALVELIPLVVPLLFCISTFGALQLTSYNSIFFNHVTSYSVILGWLLTFYWASAFEPVYRFISALQMIILKDVMSFLFFYIFVLLAYSHGLFIVMSSVPSLSQDYQSLNTVMFELLLVGCGADSRMSSDDIAGEFEKVGIDSMLFKFLFTSYIIVTMVGLLNLIIASMCDSYKKFTETDNQGWRQHSLKLSRNSIASYFISSKILHPLFKKLTIIEKNVTIKKDSRHYYIEMNYKQAMSL